MIALKTHLIRIKDVKNKSVDKHFDFMNYNFDVNFYKKALTDFYFKNIILIGYGGSINSSKAIYYALKDKIEKNVFFVDTVEPEYILNVAKSCDKSDTLIIAVSKSGNTVSLLEDVVFFLNKGFKNFIFVSSGGALKKLAEIKKFTCFKHPDIGGRFAGLTECALIPALLFGVDVKKIIDGAESVYKNKRFRKKVFSLAKEFFKLEKRGFTEIFSPSYSEYLFGINLLATQLIHETTGKNGIGQTIITAVSPESQHETNQRFFGGRKNMIGLFTTIEEHKSYSIKVSKKFWNLTADGLSFKELDRLNLSNSMNFEAEGVLRTAEKFGIPFAHLSVDKLDEFAVGELIAFWQLFSVYSAVVRKQNPFNQPEVEHSKILTARLIKDYKRDHKNRK